MRSSILAIPTPNACYDCIFFRNRRCFANGEEVYNGTSEFCKKRPSTCPLKDLTLDNVMYDDAYKTVYRLTIYNKKENTQNSQYNGNDSIDNLKQEINDLKEEVNGLKQMIMYLED